MLCGHAGAQEAQSLSIQTIISSALAGAQHGLAAQANADLLLSCLQRQPSPAHNLAEALHAILGLPIPTVSDGSPGLSAAQNSGHAKDSDAVQSSQAAFRGAPFAVLLVQRLLHTTVQQPSQVLDWHSPALDSLACQLAAFASASASAGMPGARAVEAEGAADDHAVSDTASLAASVAAAPLDASEQTAAAQETPIGYISNGLSRLDMQQESGNKNSCAQLLGLCISGIGNVSLLTDQAVEKVLLLFTKSLEAAASHPGKLYFVKPSCRYLPEP